MNNQLPEDSLAQPLRLAQERLPFKNEQLINAFNKILFLIPQDEQFSYDNNSKNALAFLIDWMFSQSNDDLSIFALKISDLESSIVQKKQTPHFIDQMLAKLLLEAISLIDQRLAQLLKDQLTIRNQQTASANRSQIGAVNIDLIPAWYLDYKMRN